MAPRPFSYAQIAVSAGVVNALINAPIGFALVPDGGQLPTWGVPGVALDVLATAFGIGFGTGLVVTPQIRRQLAAGKLEAPILSPIWRKAYAGWPRNLLHRAWNLGVLSVLLCAPLPLAGLALLAPEGLDRVGLTVLKGAFGFAVGALLTPLIAAAATVKPQP